MNAGLDPKELDRHPDKQAIMSFAQKEVQQLIDMQVGVEQTDEQVRKLQKDPTVRILNSRFVHKRKYKISPADNKDYFDKWKSRLAAQGQHQELGIDCVWNTFSPSLGFSAIRTLISLMCDRKQGFAIGKVHIWVEIGGQDFQEAAWR
jgi:hypothetical protein